MRIMNMAYYQKFIKRTIATWQPYSKQPLTAEDAREIAENMVDLFMLLGELDKKYGKEKKKP